MVFALIALAVLCVIGIRFAKPKQLHSGYIDIEQTTAINGIFVILVVFSHFAQYSPYRNPLDAPYNELRNILGQLVVSTFLFYSGYGVCCSIRKKGRSYVNSIPWKRFCKVLLHFDIAIGIFMIVNLLTGKSYSIKTVLLSLFGWSAVGNSNWYIFAVLAAYLITFIAFEIFGEKSLGAVITVTALSFVYIFVMRIFKESWWYDTFLCYAAGMWFCLLKDKLDALLKKHYWLYWVMLIGCAAAWYPAFIHRQNILLYELHAILFVLFFVLLCMKVRITNPVLNWFGKNVFGIYVLQRIPMRLFGMIPAIKALPYVHLALSFAATVVLAYLFKLMTDAIDGVLFDRKRKAVQS